MSGPGSCSWNHKIMWSWKIMWQTKIIKVPKATELGRMVTYLKRLLFIKSHGTLITWSCKIKLKLLHLQYHSAHGHQTWQDANLPWVASIHKVIWSCCVARSCDKLKPSYLHYHSTYDHQTLQDGNSPSWAPATWPYDPMILWSCKVVWQNETITSPLVHMATKRGWIPTYLEEFPFIKLFDPLVTCSQKITWETKAILSPLPQCLWLLNLLSWRLMLTSSYHSVTWSLIRWSYLDHVSVWKIYISTLTRLVATKLGRVLTTGRRFSTQMLKLSPTFCLNLFYIFSFIFFSF